MVPEPKISKDLSALLKDFCQLDAKFNCSIEHLSLDSRISLPNSLFFAVSGQHFDGRDFIEQAIKNGAVACLQEAEIKPEIQIAEYNGKQIPIISIHNLTQKLGVITSRFYSHPSKQLKMIGVTGTNGKTSICHYLAQALTNAQQKCALLGTAGIGFIDDLEVCALTTPNALEIQSYLANFYQKGAAAVSMEASSHGLEQGRTSGVAFDIAVFTNLTHEHLDYHGSLENYFAAKKRLFTSPGLKTAIINSDNEYGRRLVNELNDSLDIYTYGIEANNEVDLNKHIAAQIRKVNPNGIEVHLQTPWGSANANIPLLGRFNVSNCLAVITCLCVLGIDLREAIAYIEQLKGVLGRMECFGGEQLPLVVVDYAHTPDALANALQELKSCCTGKLWCVFGCGGNRDQYKRQIMGEIAKQHADHIVLTNDNPRQESPEKIVADIQVGIGQSADLVVELDREKAITHAINQALVNDVVLVAGKGHEDYQIIGDQRRPFKDQTIVYDVLQAKQNLR